MHNDETIRVEQFFTGSYDDWKEVNDVWF
jgi:hypothetical protein